MAEVSFDIVPGEEKSLYLSFTIYRKMTLEQYESAIFSSALQQLLDLPSVSMEAIPPVDFQGGETKLNHKFRVSSATDVSEWLDLLGQALKADLAQEKERLMRKFERLSSRGAEIT